MNYLIYISPVKPDCQAQEGNIRLSLMFRPYGAERKSDTDGVKTWRVPAQVVTGCVFGVGMHLQCQRLSCFSESDANVFRHRPNPRFNNNPQFRVNKRPTLFTFRSAIIKSHLQLL